MPDSRSPSHKGRLSRSQKWILLAYVGKVLMNDNSFLTLARGMKRRLEEDEKYRETYWKYLFRDEILKDYYGVVADGDYWGKWRFHWPNRNMKEQVSVSRSIRNLIQKGWMASEIVSGGREGLSVTDLGENEAKRLWACPEREEFLTPKCKAGNGDKKARQQATVSYC